MTTVPQPSVSDERFRREHSRLIKSLWDKAHQPGSPWRAPEKVFAAALHRSCLSRFSQSLPSTQDTRKHLESLHVEDLALACACSVGIESAWEDFFARFRPVIDAASRAIAGPDLAQELASSIYSELYGVRGRSFPEEPSRRPLFDYFHGRSKLSTWLRAVLAQRHIDLLRERSRTDSLDDLPGDANTTVAGSSLSHPHSDSSPDPDRSRYLSSLQSALTSALDALPPRDRLRLAYYYSQELTLAQIGRLTGVHEATVSRKLEKTRRSLRKHIERILLEDNHWSEAQIDLCFQYAVEGNLPIDLDLSPGPSENASSSLQRSLSSAEHVYAEAVDWAAKTEINGPKQARSLPTKKE